jgi:hypothetical protein
VRDSHRPAFSTVRPAELRQACLVTWVCAGLVLVGSAMIALTFAVDPSLPRKLFDQDPTLADLGVTRATMRSSGIAFSSIMALWSTAAIVLAVFAFLGKNWARLALAASAGLAGMAFVGGTLYAPGLVIPALTCWVVAFLLLRPQVSNWFTDRF